VIASYQPIADGAAGVAAIVEQLNTIKDHYGRLPCMRSAAVCLVRDLGDNDQAGQLAAVAAFVRCAVCYVCDPLDCEYVQTPDRLLVDFVRHGRAQGDCDDHCVLFATLAQALGIPCEIVAVNTGAGGVPDHVICLAQVGAESVPFDLVQK
jgi:hypothetical protein